MKILSKWKIKYEKIRRKGINDKGINDKGKRIKGMVKEMKNENTRSYGGNEQNK